MAKTTTFPIIFWVVVTAVLLVMIALLELWAYRGESSASALAGGQYVAQQPLPNPVYVLSSALVPLVPATLSTGLIRFDNSSFAQSLVRTIVGTVPSVAPVWGTLWVESLQFFQPTLNALAYFVVQSNNNGTRSYQTLTCTPIGKAAPAMGYLTYVGNYNCIMATPISAASAINMFILSALPSTTLVQQLTTPSLLYPIMEGVIASIPAPYQNQYWLISGGPILLGNASKLPTNVTQTGMGGSYVNTKLMLGMYANIAAFLLYAAILLLLELLLSLLLTKEKRENQMLYIILCSCAIGQDVFLAVNFESVVGSTSSANAACMVIGFGTHISLIATMCWNAAASLNLFFILYEGGLQRNKSFWKNPGPYHLVIWLFVALQIIVIWALRAAPPIGSLSFGPVGSWNFCWISNGLVLLVAFFVPTCLIMLMNIILTTYLCVLVLQIRSNARGIKWSSVMEVAAIFFTVNSGSVATGIMAILFLIFKDDPLPYMSTITGALFFLQALSLYVVFFCRKDNMESWYMFFKCKLGDLQKSSGSRQQSGASNSTGSTATPTTSGRDNDFGVAM